VRSAPFSPLQQAEIPLRARALGLDLLHSPYFIKPYVGLPCPSVVTIYDLLGWRFPQTLSPRGRLLYRLTMGMAVRGANALITISQSARDDLAARYRLPKERIVVTPLAASRRFAPQPPEAVDKARARYGLPESYVLYLGSNKPHKNLERLVLAWERAGERASGAQLILAGHEDVKHPQARRLVAERGMTERVRFLPNVADDDLAALYSGAAVFAFVSYYEGFGLPPLEAMACGAPVLCANTSSLPEVVGDAALTVDPYNMIEIAEGLTRLLSQPALRRDMRERGLRRAHAFSWRRTALETLRVYEALGDRGLCSYGGGGRWC
jgi:alpha-1,3-rhamnosyl/mannosyltransferase